MFARLLVVLALIAVAAAFGPARMAVRSSRMQMSAERPNMAKVIAAGVMSASLFGSAAFAVEGASPKQSFFGDSQYSSPFTVNENREDPLYSPYSPYGIDMMTIDNLPNEMPRDASRAFGEMFILRVLPEFFKPQSSILERATIAKAGQLAKHFSYLQNYVDGKERELATT